MIIKEKEESFPIPGEKEKGETPLARVGLYNQKLLEMKKRYMSYCLTPS